MTDPIHHAGADASAHNYYLLNRPVFTIVIPTHRPDRPIARTLRSIARQETRQGDLVLVVGDIHSMDLPDVAEIVRGFDNETLRGYQTGNIDGARYRYLPYDGQVHDWGHSQLNHGIASAPFGSWIMCQDDDDVYLPGAFRAIRGTIEQYAVDAILSPLMFRFLAPWREETGRTRQVIWKTPELIQDNVGGHCLVVPNRPGMVGKYTSRYAGDYDWIVDTLKRWETIGQPARWVDQVITCCRPDTGP